MKKVQSIFLIIVFSLFGGFLSSLLFPQKLAYAQQKESNILKILKTEKLIIVDKDGKEMLDIGSDDNGRTFRLLFKDNKNTPRFIIRISEEGRPSLNLYDKKGHSRIELSLLSFDHPGFKFIDDEGIARIEGLLTSVKGPQLLFRDEEGNKRSGISFDGDHNLEISAYDENNNLRLHLHPSGISLWDENFSSHSILSHSTLLISDTDGRPKLILSKEKDQEIWIAP